MKMDIQVGAKFGRLTVTARVGARTRCECLCECGNIKEVAAYKLFSGEVKSCGCARKLVPGTEKERLLKCMNVRPSGCWEWARYRNARGDGVFWFRNEKWPAHRAAHEIFKGPIPEELIVLHRCDNPPCINPDHLTTGTNADNVKDMRSKWRHSYGTKNPQAKLTEDAVILARARREAGEKLIDIARDLGVSDSTAYYAITGRNWAHASPSRSSTALRSIAFCVRRSEITA